MMATLLLLVAALAGPGPATGLPPARDPAALPEVIVTASGQESSPDQLPAAATVVGREGLRRASARVDVADALRAVPGIVVRDRHNYAQDLQIAARAYGARATFGVRGVRLYVNGIPATAADGQGQIAHAMLDHASRIEVVRGPFAALYGNASGGVVQVQVDPAAQEGDASLFAASSPDYWRLAATAHPRAATARASVAISRFDYSGFRPHSSARRDTLDLVASGEPGGEWRWTATANVLDAPDADDPLGLARADFDSDPDGTAPVALLFDTRKSTRQAQLGATIGREAAAWGTRISAYGGEREVEQFLAIPPAAQANPLHAGGVIDLARSYGGIDARAWHDWNLGDSRLRATLGLNLDEVEEDRRGYENFVGAQPGVRGALRRDERNQVRATDYFAQLDWDLSEGWRATLAARSSRIRVESDDDYIVGANPDDSGSLRFDATTPVAAVRYAPSETLAWHLAYGEGFETPTLNELSYRPDGAAGLNLLLEPATSRQTELGLHWTPLPGTRLEAAAFDAHTDDEIVVARNAGGRSSFRNGGRTRRRGVELALESDLGERFEAALSWTWLDARYRDASAVCVATPCLAPTAIVAAGNRLPGVPARHGFAELLFRPDDAWTLGLALEHVGNVVVDDLNRDAAGAYTTVDLHATRRWIAGSARIEAFARVANLADRRYAGSVIVNEANARYFEPAPGRRVLFGLELTWE